LSGVTLLEYVIVMAIMASLAAMVVPAFNPDSMRFSGAGQSRNSYEISTRSTMEAIRRATVGGNGELGFWDDMDHDRMFWFQTDLALLYMAPSQIPSIVVAANTAGRYRSKGLMSWDPVKSLGWRGPYMTPPGASYPSNRSADGFNNYYYNSTLNPKYFIDAWGNPIVVQFPSKYGSVTLDLSNPVHNQYYIDNTRMVSAGRNGKLDTELNLRGLPNGMPDYAYMKANTILLGDDIIVFFFKDF